FEQAMMTNIRSAVRPGVRALLAAREEARQRLRRLQEQSRRMLAHPRSNSRQTLTETREAVASTKETHQFALSNARAHRAKRFVPDMMDAVAYGVARRSLKPGWPESMPPHRRGGLSHESLAFGTQSPSPRAGRGE